MHSASWNLTGQSDCQLCPMRQLSIFAGLTVQELDNLGMTVQDIHLPAGEVLYHQGESARHAFTLRSGVIKLSLESPLHGVEKIVRLLRHGDLLGFEGLNHSHPRYPHTATTLDAADLCLLDISELNRLSEDLPHVRRALLERWQRALEESEFHIVEVGAGKADACLAAFLYHWCGVFPDGAWVPFPMARKEIAGYLGLSSAHVSRVMADFKRHGYLRESGQRIMVQRASLRKIASGMH